MFGVSTVISNRRILDFQRRAALTELYTISANADAVLSQLPNPGACELSSSTVSSIVRGNPKLSRNTVLSNLTHLERGCSLANLLCTRLFAESAGIGAALRNNEEVARGLSEQLRLTCDAVKSRCELLAKELER